MLYVVATPIGNLKDITLRALETLKSVNFILCEDTRVTRKLLDYYQIKTPTISYHQHTPERKIKEIIQLLFQGKNLAMVTDAGTPGISDPGNRLVDKLISLQVNMKKNLQTYQLTNLQTKITPIPGPCALTAALSISGFPTDKFLFLGFPPAKNKRRQFFEKIQSADETVVFYESCHRILKTLTELAQNLKTYKLANLKTNTVVCRELTKQFETIYRGNINEIIEKIKKDSQKGEFVLVIGKMKGSGLEK